VSLRVRPPRPDDVAAVVALGNAYEVALTGAGEWSEADLRDAWGDLADAGRDAWLVERDGALAGYAELHAAGGGPLDVSGCVHPGHAGHSVGARLIDLSERRAAEYLVARPGPRVVLRNAVHHADTAAPALLEARGYRAAHQHLSMRIELVAPPPAPEWPGGIAAAPFRPGADDADVDACVEDAFAHAWSNQAEWRARKVADPRFDPALWIVARAGADVCGVALCTDGEHGVGYVNALGVRAPWRRRGLGTALLRAAAATFWERGQRSVGLGVDSDNATGALRLYERAGMHVARRVDVWERELRA
jgi:mycothiol synthase